MWEVCSAGPDGIGAGTSKDVGWLVLISGSTAAAAGTSCKGTATTAAMSCSGSRMGLAADVGAPGAPRILSGELCFRAAVAATAARARLRAARGVSGPGGGGGGSGGSGGSGGLEARWVPRRAPPDIGMLDGVDIGGGGLLEGRGVASVRGERSELASAGRKNGGRNGWVRAFLSQRWH